MSRRVAYMLGGLLTVVSISLFVIAWATFEAGKPGAPPFADARPDYGVEAGMKLYVPPEAEISSVDTTVYFRDNSGTTHVDVEIFIIGDSLAQLAFPAVIEFREGARMHTGGRSKLTIDRVPAAVVVSRSGAQYIMLRIGGENKESFATVDVSGDLQISAMTTENSRTNFASPKFGDVRECDFLGPGMDVDTFADEYACNIDLLMKASVELKIEGFRRAATRLDYVEPDPADGGGTTLQWRTDNPDLGFRARASWADIAQEANVQRYLFASGVIVGIGTAVAPAAVQLLITASRRRVQPTQDDSSSIEVEGPSTPNEDNPAAVTGSPVPVDDVCLPATEGSALSSENHEPESERH